MHQASAATFLFVIALSAVIGTASLERAARADEMPVPTFLNPQLTDVNVSNDSDPLGEYRVLCPDVVDLGSGNLLIAYHRTTAYDFNGNYSSYTQASSDGGLTWSAPQLAADGTQAPGLLKLPSGDVLMNAIEMISPTSTTMRLFRSTDNGQSWTEQDPIWENSSGMQLQGGDGEMVQLSVGEHAGRILAPYHAAPPGGDNYNSNFTAYCYYSDDNGTTWQQSTGGVSLPMRGAMEPSIGQLADGSIVMAMRTQLGSIYMANSTDGGVTWSQPWSSNVEAPEAPFSMAAFPDGTGLLMIYDSGEYNPSADHFGDRTPLTATVSRDGGHTWVEVGDIVGGYDPDHSIGGVAISFLDGGEGNVLLGYNWTYDRNNRDAGGGIRVALAPPIDSTPPGTYEWLGILNNDWYEATNWAWNWNGSAPTPNTPIEISQGTLDIEYLHVGSAEGDNGMWTVTGGAVNIAEGMTVGRFGSGTFNHSGGTVTMNSTKANRVLAVGSFSTGVGIYNMDGAGAVLNVDSDRDLVIGAAGQGTFNLNDGTVNVSGIVRIGRQSTGVGVLNLNGGQLNTPAIAGGDGSGVLNWNGGVLRLTSTPTGDMISGLDNVYIKAGGANINTNGHDATVAQALLTDPTSPNGGLTKTGLGTLTLSGANTYDGETRVEEGILLVENSTGSATGNGNVVVQAGGTLGGSGFISGQVTVESGGALAPGASFGLLTLGSVVLDTDSAIAIEIGGTTQGSQYDALSVTGLATLGGALNVALIDLGGAYALTTGTSFELLTANGGLDGKFDYENLPAGYAWYLDYGVATPNTVTLQLLALRGDMNGDNLLTEDDVAPFILALTNRAAFEAMYPLVIADAAGDVNGDGTFDLGDVKQFSILVSDSAPANSNAVPEPTTFALLACSLLSLVGCRRLIDACAANEWRATNGSPDLANRMPVAGSFAAQPSRMLFAPFLVARSIHGENVQSITGLGIARRDQACNPTDGETGSDANRPVKQAVQLGSVADPTRTLERRADLQQTQHDDA